MQSLLPYVRNRNIVLLVRARAANSPDVLSSDEFQSLADNQQLAHACKEFLSHARADEIVATLIAGVTPLPHSSPV